MNMNPIIPITIVLALSMAMMNDPLAGQQPGADLTA